MKKYYIHYARNFVNEYKLYSVETAEDEKALAEIGNCERITLKNAKRKIADEKWKRTVDIGGYGDTEIIPASESSAYCVRKYFEKKYPND